MGVLLNLIAAIPIIGGVVNNFVTKYYDAKVQLYIAKTGADKDVAMAWLRAQIDAAHEQTLKLGIFASSKYLMALLVLFCIPIVAFEWKVVLYDTMLGWGSTPAVKGAVAEWMSMIMTFLFGSATLLGLGQLWFNRK